MLTIELGISKKDSDDKSVVVKRGLEKKLRDGWRPGVAPQGYLNDKTTESGFRKIHTDPKRFPFVKKIFELYYHGTPVTEIHRIAKDEWRYRTPQRKRIGGKPLSTSMFYAILNNPFYCGKFEYPVGSGDFYEGKHEKAISEEMFNEIQRMLGRKAQYNLKHHTYAYTGLMRCGACGSGIVADEKWQVICPDCKYKFSVVKKHKEECPKCGKGIDNAFKVLHYLYYRCGRKKDPNCQEGSIRVDRMEEQIDAKLSQIEISPLFMDWAIKQIHKMNKQEKDFREESIQAIKKAHDDCRIKLDNLLTLKISPENTDGSLLNDEEYKRQKQVLESELKKAESQLTITDDRMIQANEDAVKAFTFATKARKRFEKGDPKTKREIFRALGLNLTLKNRKAHYDSPKYLFTLKKMKKEAPVIGERVEPEEWPMIEPQMEQIYASIPTVLRG